DAEQIEPRIGDVQAARAEGKAECSEWLVGDAVRHDRNVWIGRRLREVARCLVRRSRIATLGIRASRQREQHDDGQRLHHATSSVPRKPLLVEPRGASQIPRQIAIGLSRSGAKYARVLERTTMPRRKL